MDTQILNYEITWDELEIEGEGKIPESLKPRLQDLSDDARNGKPGVIDQLKKLIKKYPSIVQLKNYLYVAYQAMDNLEKATQINDQILEQHPDYLFARIHKAYKYYQDGEHEKMPELLGKGFDLQILYPNRDIFHISEFLAMQGMAVRYFSANGELEEVENRLKLMKEMDGDALQTEVAEKIYRKSVLEKGLERMKKEKERRIAPENQFHLKKIEFNRPEFNFPVTADLYRHELDIQEEVLQAFFDHDRDQVIEDLENVLKDSYYNYDPKNEYSKNSFATIHAFFLLGDLEAEESLPVVLEMMEQSEQYLDDVFGDLFTESGWIPLFKMGKNQLDALVEYLRLPGTNTFFKSGVSDALEQIWYHIPEKRPEIETIFGELLDYKIHANPEDNVIDTLFNGFLISCLLDLKLGQFIPQIENMYKKDYVDLSVCGSFDDVKKNMFSDSQPSRWKRNLQNTKEIYASFTAPIESPSRIDPPQQRNQPIVRTAKKVGRNDPCPCGSGKKYKKCCLHKN